MPKIDEMRRIASAATKRPWKWVDVDDGYFEVLIGPGYNPEYLSIDKMRVMDDGSASGEYARDLGSDTSNGKFIALAANTHDKLLDVAEAAEKYCFEPAHNVEDREIILNRRHDAFKKLVFALKNLESGDG